MCELRGNQWQLAVVSKQLLVGGDQLAVGRKSGKSPKLWGTPETRDDR